MSKFGPEYTPLLLTTMTRESSIKQKAQGFMLKDLILTLFMMISLQASAKNQPQLYDRFWKNTSESFSKNLPWHLTAIALTPVFISSGIDARVHNAFKGTDVNWFLPGITAGYIAPFVISIPLYVIGKAKNNHKTLSAAFAVAQTSIITLSTVSLLKSFTGRPAPDSSSDTSIQRQSREFNFGFLNRGIYDGWPSGHMATITSISSTLIHFYPEKTWLKWTGYASMTYIMMLISAEHRSQFHWFSDGVAGAMMGYAIGKTVGTNMRVSVMGVDPVPEKKIIDILPILSPGRSGVQVVWFQ